MSQKINIKILIAPLDWGLGHATRCIPIINQLNQLGCKVIIAAEGAQEKLLKTEFPTLSFVKLPGYRIKYSGNKRFFSLKIIFQLPKIFSAIRYEKRWLQNFLIKTPVDAVIADNRYGLYNLGVPTVFITHQLLIKGPSAVAEKLMQKLNYLLISKFSRCWVPDEPGKINLGGLLSHPQKLPILPVDYIGGISRFQRKTVSIYTYDLLFVISGPEPQRTLFENRIVEELTSFKGSVMLVRGLPESGEKLQLKENVVVRNHLPAQGLEEVFNESKLIISRSGYTTVMDICKLQKKAVLIPTPGQTEQEYLATHLHQQHWCMSMQQEEFSLLELLKKAAAFNFLPPVLDMEKYKVVVDAFINELRNG